MSLLGNDDKGHEVGLGDGWVGSTHLIGHKIGVKKTHVAAQKQKLKQA